MQLKYAVTFVLVEAFFQVCLVWSTAMTICILNLSLKEYFTDDLSAEEKFNSITFDYIEVWNNIYS